MNIKVFLLYPTTNNNFMKKLIISIFFSSILSCSVDNSLSNEHLKGHWVECKKNSYSELYFENDLMFSYDIASGDITKFKYKIKGPIFKRALISNNDTVNLKYSNYDLVSKVKLKKIELRERSFINIDSSQNVLFQYLTNEISRQDYFNAVAVRSQLELICDE